MQAAIAKAVCIQIMLPGSEQIVLGIDGVSWSDEAV